MVSTNKPKVVPQANRIAYLDIAKGIGILLVVFAHINIKGPIYQTIYSFHMPLFFILAGMTFSTYGSFSEFIGKKAKRLLLPYIVYSLITFAWYALVEVKMPEFTGLTRNQTVFGSFMEIFLARGSVDFLQHNPALWFIPCLFITELIYYALCQCRKSVKLICGIILGVCGYLFTLDYMPQLFRELPWQVGVGFVAIPFLMIGEYIKNKFTLEGLRKPVLNKKWLSVVLIIIAFAVVVGLTFLNTWFLPNEGVGKTHVSMGTKHLGNIGLFYVTACIGAFAVIALSVLIEYWSRDRVALHKSWLCWLGEKSYAIMAIHYPVKRRMVVIVAQAINAWHLYPITGLYTTFTSNHLLPSFIAFIFTMVITVIIAISAQSFSENAQFGHRKKERRDVEE